MCVHALSSESMNTQNSQNFFGKPLTSGVRRGAPNHREACLHPDYALPLYYPHRPYLCSERLIVLHHFLQCTKLQCGRKKGKKYKQKMLIAFIRLFEWFAGVEKKNVFNQS